MLFIDKAGFPWQPLKQVPSACTFSEVCFIKAKVWCLKVADACRDRHGISWAERRLEVTAWVWGASGPLSRHACPSIQTMRVSQCTVAHLEVEGRMWLWGDRGQARVFAPLCFPVVVCTATDHVCGLWNDRLQVSSDAGSHRRRDLWKLRVKLLSFCFRLNTYACVKLTKCLYVFLKKTIKNPKTRKSSLDTSEAQYLAQSPLLSLDLCLSSSIVRACVCYWLTRILSTFYYSQSLGFIISSRNS